MGTHLAQTRGNDPSSTLLRDLLMGKIPAYEVPAHPENRPGRATGILAGGNLSTFTPILGTPADATLGRDIILFIEEVGEDMSHIDRLINTLILNGVFDRCRGIVLGEFTECKANLDFDSVEDMICSYVPEGIPVLCGFPTGHDDVNLPLVMGAPVTLNVTEKGASLTFDMKGQQVRVRTEDTVAGPTQGGPVIKDGEKQRKLVRIFDFLKHFEGIRR
jgi:muramoyltetrapeptide carboxypeptidase